jgi:hypothetical protein
MDTEKPELPQWGIASSMGSIFLVILSIYFYVSSLKPGGDEGSVGIIVKFWVFLIIFSFIVLFMGLKGVIKNDKPEIFAIVGIFTSIIILTIWIWLGIWFGVQAVQNILHSLS